MKYGDNFENCPHELTSLGQFLFYRCVRTVTHHHRSVNFYFTVLSEPSQDSSLMKEDFHPHLYYTSPIITTQSTIQFDKRDSTLSQASQFVQLLKDAMVSDNEVLKAGLTEILTEAFPKLGASANGWPITPEPTDTMDNVNPMGTGGGLGEL